MRSVYLFLLGFPWSDSLLRRDACPFATSA